MNDERKEHLGALVRFPVRGRGRESRSETDSTGAPAFPKVPGVPHPVTRYLRWLRAEGLLPRAQYRTLAIAVSGLRRRFPNLSRQTVEAVRAEMLGDGPDKHQLAGIELRYWRDAIKNGVEPIPRLDFDRLYRRFVVRPLLDRDQVVVPIDGTSRGNLPEYVPPRLAMAECFFLITLRIFRKQYEHDSSPNRTSPVSILDQPHTAGPPLHPPAAAPAVRPTFWQRVWIRMRWWFSRNPWRDLADGEFD